MRSIRRPMAAAAAMLMAVPWATAAPAQEDDAAPAYREGDRSLVALNVLPPGQGRYLNAAEAARSQAVGEQPPENTSQLEMYDRMVSGAPDILPGDLDLYFKDASFGVRPDDVAGAYEPRPGVTVVRDASHNVPHVYGETRADVMFGAGYVSGEDRLFMMDVLRHLGRGRLTELLGASDANLAQERAQFAVADYTEEELQAMLDRLPELEPELGVQARQDLLDFTDGVNAYILEALLDPTKLPAEYPALQLLPRPWKATDSAAIASLIGSQLGVGGGAELRNARFLKALQDAGHTPDDARRIFDDFRFADDPEAPVTTEKRFTWLTDLPTPSPAAVAMPDDPAAAAEPLPESPGVIDGPFGPIHLGFPDGASNALMVTRSRSKTGRPLAVFGPQTGYWSPEILMEIDMHGPGIHARGAAFPGISLYVLLGRGAGYAWSATSAGGDQVDVRASELCEPDGSTPTPESIHYLRGDECVELYRRTESWLAKPSAGGVPSQPSPDRVLVERTTERTDTGIVQARGTVDGKPVVFVTQRASYNAEVDSALAYVEILDPGRTGGAADFQRAFGRFSFTFNWFYLDDRDIAFQLGGYHPLRAPGVDPDLPSWDRPEWAWRGMLSFARTPKAVNPKRGFIGNWNNKQAPRFRAADDQWSYGPVHRSLLLDDRIRAASKDDGKVDLVELVNAMGDAATVDLRGDRLAPLMLQVIGGAPTQRLQRAVDLLQEWQAAGAHRRDRDGDGRYEHAPAVALMDAWWSRALDAVFRPTLGAAFDVVPLGHDNRPGPNGSAYISGWYGQLHKDLRTVLSRPVKGPFSRTYCGGGHPADCRSALLASLDAAVAELETRFGADPSVWEANAEGDRIRFAAVGVQEQESIRWQNRPTFQQVLEFGDLCPGLEHLPGRHIVGTAKNDVLIGTSAPEVLCGLAGNDVLRGRGGNDRIYGGPGNDRLYGGRGNDRLYGGPGNDLLNGGRGRDRCDGGSGKDRLRRCRHRR